MQRNLRFISILVAIGLLTISVNATEYFDEYGKIDWKTEKMRLIQFEGFLLRNPDMIGYIGFHWSTQAEYVEMKRRALRARRYLIGRMKLKAARVVIIEGRKRTFPRTILQPVRKGAPPPKFGLSQD